MDTKRAGDREEKREWETRKNHRRRKEQVEKIIERIKKMLTTLT